MLIENGSHSSPTLSPDTCNLTSFVHFQRTLVSERTRLSEQHSSDAELVKASVRHSSGACLTFITLAFPLPENATLLPLSSLPLYGSLPK